MFKDQARQKWCPETRCGNEAGCNRADANDKCIASDCMMWQWEEGAKADETGEMICESEMGVREAGGYCGLAGKP